MSDQLPQAVTATNVEIYKASTDAASICREIVVASAIEIKGRKYVRVEGWQAIAVAHGCVAASRDVERVEGGVRAIGEVRRMVDGQIISEAEGFVGEDEATWYGGETEVWDKRGRAWVKRTLPKRSDYAIRAMAQTRAISRACRSAFAHVVVMMNAGLSTTPAEEVPPGGFDDSRDDREEVVQHQSARPNTNAGPTSGSGNNASAPVNHAGADSPAEPSEVARKAAREDYNKLAGRIRTAPHVEALDNVMHDDLALLERVKRVSATGYESLVKMAEARRAALEDASSAPDAEIVP